MSMSSSDEEDFIPPPTNAEDDFPKEGWLSSLLLSSSLPCGPHQHTAAAAAAAAAAADPDKSIIRNVWNDDGIVATEGRIIAQISPKGRRPALYQWESQPSVLTGQTAIQIVTQEEVDASAAAATAAAAARTTAATATAAKTTTTTTSPSDYQSHMLNQLQERLAFNLHNYAVANVLPDCFLHALLEEAWCHFLKRESAALLLNNSSTNNGSNHAGPFMGSPASTATRRASYYSSTHVATTSSTSSTMQQQQQQQHGEQQQQQQSGDTTNISFTVSSLHQRIKAGTQLAHAYFYAHSNYAASLTADNFASLRRSRRIPKPVRPNPYQKGGKIAHYLLERWNMGEKEEIKEEKKGKDDEEDEEAQETRGEEEEEQKKDEVMKEEVVALAQEKENDDKTVEDFISNNKPADKAAIKEKVEESGSSAPAVATENNNNDVVVDDHARVTAIAVATATNEINAKYQQEGVTKVVASLAARDEQGSSNKEELPKVDDDGKGESTTKEDAAPTIKDDSKDKDGKDEDESSSTRKEEDAATTTKDDDGKDKDDTKMDDVEEIEEEKEEVILIDAHEEDLESEENEADEDDDFDTNDEVEDDEDDDLQGVVKERDQLDIDFDGLQQQDKDKNCRYVEEEEDDDDEDGDYVSNNPYLQPTPEMVLDWLGRRGKSMGIAELQEAIGLCMKQNLGLYDLSIMDQLAILGNSKSQGDTFVLESTEKWKDLKKYDATAFARCKFRLKSDTEEEQEWFRQQELEENHRKDKAWASWRFKGIHGGFTVWPSWTDSVEEWIKGKKGEAPPLSVVVTPAENPAGATTDDLALAQSLATDAATSSRRSARRANTTNDAVFYGSHTQMSQKQLMETLVRLCKQSTYHTLLGLQALVGEDSANPVHRLRIAVGRLVWKRNQLNRQRVTSLWSDQPLWTSLNASPLWTIENDESLDPDTKSCANALVKYLRQLHQTELQLRNMVLRQLTYTHLSGIATAADERVGTLESFDSTDFENPENIEWATTGHDYLGKSIFRPGQQPATEHLECRWYKIKDYADSVAYDGPIDEKNDTGATLAERRMRFRAMPGDDYGEALILTEAQVAAGLNAAKEATEQDSKSMPSEHPFAGGVGTSLTLKAATSTMQCVVVGYDTVYVTAPGEIDRQYRTLLLPEAKGARKEAFWIIVSSDDDGNLACCIADASEPITFKIEQSDYELESSAFRACQGVVNFLNNHKHASIFMDPVDPVALNIPSYFDVVKQPMDISTLSENLEKGLYSKIPPTKSVGRTAVSRMLNGPFREDALLMFDNAILFNPPDDWIHQTAKVIRRAVIKKIEQAANEADYGGSNGRRFGFKSDSVYVDEDSDIDMYEYESDRDDEGFESGKRARKRKRKSGASKDDVSTKAMQGPVRLQKTLSETLGLRGPFANLPIVSDADGFSLRPEWSCRHHVKKRSEKQQAKDEQARKELQEILELQRQAEESDRASLRRSARVPLPDDHQLKSKSSKYLVGKVVYHLLENLPGMPLTLTSPEMTATSRAEIETLLEQSHEKYYAKLHQLIYRHLGSDSRNGVFANASFPPYLGRVSPPCLDNDEATWEIRSEYVVPAVRWVIRGLVQSGHLVELEPLTVESPFTSGVIMTSDIYFHDPANNPFHLLEIRRKKKDGGANDESSEDEIELSEYEKLRADRVARNAERLKMLGLA